MAREDQGRLDTSEGVEFAGQGGGVDALQPWRVDRGPQDLSPAQLLVGQFGGVLGHGLQDRPEAVGAEERPRAVVEEPHGDGVVEGRGSERGEGALGQGQLLAGVDEVDPVHRQRGKQPHDADAEEGGDDPQLGVFLQQGGQ